MWKGKLRQQLRYRTQKGPLSASIGNDCAERRRCTAQSRPKPRPARASVSGGEVICDERQRHRGALMRPKGRVPAPRCSNPAVWTVICGRGARLPLLKTPERAILRPATPGIGECRVKETSRGVCARSQIFGDIFLNNRRNVLRREFARRPRRRRYASVSPTNPKVSARPSCNRFAVLLRARVRVCSRKRVAAPRGGRDLFGRLAAPVAPGACWRVRPKSRQWRSPLTEAAPSARQADGQPRERTTMAKVYWITTYRSISNPDAFAA